MEGLCWSWQYLASALMVLHNVCASVVEEVRNAQEANNSSRVLSLVNIGKQPTAISTPSPNATEPSVSKTKPEDHSWKTHIIIFCTIAVAVEIVIVFVVIMHWQRIRWTLRKLTCPCQGRRRRTRQHRPVDQHDHIEAIEISSSEAEPVSPPTRIQHVQIEPIPSTSSGHRGDRGRHMQAWRFGGPHLPSQQNSGSTSEDEG